MQVQSRKILVTGASGFIGSFVVEEALRKGFEVWAAVRPTSSKRYLKDERIHFIILDLERPEVLKEQLQAHTNEYGHWEYIVHAAGATKTLDKNDFFHINYEGTRHLCDALYELRILPLRFIYISTLSVFGPVRERPATPCGKYIYAPILDTDTPKPNTAYGQSKLKAEEYLHHFSDFPYVILRPTGVYGPRERDYFLMAKSIQEHIDFSVGFRPQEITFVYVKDLVQAIFLAMERGALQSMYFITDDKVYSSRTYSDLLQKELDVKQVFHFKAPLWILRVICTISGFFASIRGKFSTLNSDKYYILRQRNWQCDISPAKSELGYRPQYDLAAGLKETIDWYKKEQWL